MKIKILQAPKFVFVPGVLNQDVCIVKIEWRREREKHWRKEPVNSFEYVHGIIINSEAQIISLDLRLAIFFQSQNEAAGNPIEFIETKFGAEEKDIFLLVSHLPLL